MRPFGLPPLPTCHPGQSRQRGIALVFVLIMISITFVIAAVSSRVVTLGERAARNDRARQTAFQAAEAALSDAEIDIMGATGVTAVRVAMFGTLPADAGCSSSVDDVPPSRGFCGPLDTGAYKAIFADESASPQYATFGQFTGRAAQLAVGAAGLPEKLPRYIIEKSSVSFRNRAAAAGKPFDAFIVTAIGYGPSNSGARVVLQGVISKPAPTN